MQEVQIKKILNFAKLNLLKTYFLKNNKTVE